MKSLNNFASLEITSTEEIKGGTFGLFSLLKKSSYCHPTPPPAPCYTAPAPSCNTGGYTPTNYCAPKPKLSFSFSFSLGGCK